MIEVGKLSKSYGPKMAIQDVSFQVEKGEIMGFLGPNGAGKTTTMRILTCFMPATSGTARVAGFDVFKDSLEVRKRVGYVPENVPLYGELEVTTYLNFVGEVKGLSRQARKQMLGRVIEETGLLEVRNELIRELSRGYRQRVGLAQALINDPEILILDEPTVGLDPKQIIEMRKLIKNVAGKKTVILSTHILPEVSMTCQRVIIINEGKLIAIDTPENLNSQLQKTTKISMQIKGPIPEIVRQLGQIRGVTRVTPKESFNQQINDFIVETEMGLEVRKELANLVVKKGWGLMEMKSVGMSLEDIFIQLVTEEEEI